MRRRAVLLFTIVLAVMAVEMVERPAYAATITVNSTADTEANDGVCTLREAIKAANTDTASGASEGVCLAGSGTDTIIVSIPDSDPGCNTTSGVCTISPSPGLPDITNPVIIDGYSQGPAPTL
jgi:CSLREA domain-containing protein